MGFTSTKENKTKIVDLKIQYSFIKDEIEIAVKSVLSSGSYILGENVKSFEDELAKYIGCRYLISCGNGTDAIVLALKALDIGNSDEVITVSHSYFATSEAIALVGAKPVFVDINESDFCIDISKIEKLISNKTKAIIPVHLYGQPCEIDSVIAIAKKHNLYVIEDCAQAIGARFNKKHVGTFGDIGTLSFFPTKNLGAFGDAGAVIANNDEVAEKIRKLRAHGSSKRYIHDYIGLNSRLDEIQAAVLRVKLKYIEEWNQKRKNAADFYSKVLDKVQSLILPKTKPNCNHVFHQYTVRVKENKRDYLCEKLNELGIESIIYYPVPIHMQKAFDYLGCKEGMLPVTEKICDEILSLPIYPEITEEIQRDITNKVIQLI